MAKATLEEIIDILSDKDCPRNRRNIQAGYMLQVWDRLPKRGTKVFYFVMGMLLSPIRTPPAAKVVNEIKQAMPDEPTEEILDAMIDAGVKPMWAKDVYNAIKKEVNK